MIQIGVYSAGDVLLVEKRRESSRTLGDKAIGKESDVGADEARVVFPRGLQHRQSPRVVARIHAQPRTAESCEGAALRFAGELHGGGGILLLATLFGIYPFLKKLFADAAYQGPEFNKTLVRILPCLKTEIVKRSDQAKGFVVLPKRWIVERTLAWLNRCRRLTKDWENLNRTALAFLRLASIRLMLRKLCNPH